MQMKHSQTTTLRVGLTIPDILASFSGVSKRESKISVLSGERLNSLMGAARVKAVSKRRPRVGRMIFEAKGLCMRLLMKDIPSSRPASGLTEFDSRSRSSSWVVAPSTLQEVFLYWGWQIKVGLKGARGQY